MNEKKSLMSFFKNKAFLGFGLRIILLLSYLAALIFMGKDIGLNYYEIYITLAGMIGTTLFFGPIFYLIIFFPIIFMLLIDIHLFHAYGYSLLSFGAQIGRLLLDTNKAEVFEYVERIGLFNFVFSFFLILCLIYASLHKPKLNGLSKSWKMMIFITVFLGYPFGYVSHIQPLLLSLFSPKAANILAKADMFRFMPSSETKADTVVILIGESHRYPEFSKAFHQYSGRFPFLYEFSDIISKHPGTIDSVPMILSRKKGIERIQFFHEKSLFALFKEAGYATYFVHYVGNASEMNGLGQVYQQAENFIQYEENVTQTTDEKILPVLDKILAFPEKKKLIVIKMIGIHVSFANRYPHTNVKKTVSERFFSLFKKQTKEKEMTHYKNAVSYSAGIINDIMTRINDRKEPSLLFFSSDHGICIFDKGTFHLPPNCRNAFHVPAMFLLNASLNAITDQHLKDNLSCNTDKPLTAEYDFETIATLAGISYPTADKSYDLTQLCNPLEGKKRPVRIMLGSTALYEDL